MILGWMELKEEDVPPQHMWLDNEALSDHFERVKEKAGRPAGMEEIEEQHGEMTQNEFTRGLKAKG